MDIREVRRHNLKKLMDDKFGPGARGAQSRLAEMLGKPQNLLSRYLAPPEKSGSKTIGEDFAREVEAAFELPRYGLDHPLVSNSRGEIGSNVEQGPPIISPTRRIEIVGTAQLGNDGYWVGLDTADGWVETWSRDEDAYALRLKGDSMAPAIRSGWIAVCEPNHRLVPGEYVMVTTTDGQSMVKELLFENEEGVNLASVNSAYGERRVIAWTGIEKIHYVGNILAPSKVLGRF
ncbi:S24 family peptidase [Pseudomonas sp. NPDC087612]|uniref:S24 family peptidase n=1 Tax=Pseudomonas sp. NPDC087612 TaxID=3364441 RepID=UPI0037F17ACD